MNYGAFTFNFFPLRQLVSIKTKEISFKSFNNKSKVKNN